MNGFADVSYKVRVFEKEFTEKTETVAKIFFSRTPVSLSGIVPVKFYVADGETYAYLTDKTLVKISDNTVVSTGFTSDKIPLVTSVIRNGVKSTLFIGDVNAKVGDETVSGIPYGNSCALCAGRLFIACENKIKFSGEFDFTEFNVGLAFGGFIQVGAEDGEVLFLAEENGKLSVVCEHAAYIITPYGEEYEFTMEKVPSFALDVKKNTVFKTGSRIGFISGDNFCLFTGGKIKKAGSALSSVAGSSYGIAGGGNGCYFVSLTAGTTDYVYAYDTVNGEELLLMADGYSVFGGYAVKSGDNALYKLSFGAGADTVTENYSGVYDFGSCAKKAVCRVEAHIRGSANLIVVGDGRFNATLTEKCNNVSCFVHGRSFNIGFESASEDFKLYRLAVHYIIYGE